MTTPSHQPDRQPSEEPRERTFDDVLHARIDRRRNRIRDQIRKDREGNHKIPTWLYATVLGLLLLGWLYLIFFD